MSKLDCINATKDYVQGRSFVESHLVVSTDQLRDSTIPLKNVVPLAA